VKQNSFTIGNSRDFTNLEDFVKRKTPAMWSDGRSLDSKNIEDDERLYHNHNINDFWLQICPYNGGLQLLSDCNWKQNVFLPVYKGNGDPVVACGLYEVIKLLQHVVKVREHVFEKDKGESENWWFAVWIKAGEGNHRCNLYGYAYVEEIQE